MAFVTHAVNLATLRAAVLLPMLGNLCEAAHVAVMEASEVVILALRVRHPATSVEDPITMRATARPRLSSATHVGNW